MTTAKKPKPPKPTDRSTKPPATLKTSGKALWRDVTEAFDLAEYELALLRQAGETLDAIDRLQAALGADDVLDVSPQGRRVHPALPELRQQRIVFARIVAQLGVPTGDEDDERAPKGRQRRATRGTYAMRAVS